MPTYRDGERPPVLAYAAGTRPNESTPVTPLRLMVSMLGLFLYAILTVGACVMAVGFAQRRHDPAAVVVCLFLAGFLILRTAAVAGEFWTMCRHHRGGSPPSPGK